MARFDNRFDGYNPAPLDQGMIDRGVRTTAGAATGAFSGGIIGALSTPIIVGAGAALAVGGIAFAGVALLGALAGIVGAGGAISAVVASAPVIGSISAAAGILSGVAGLVGAPVGGFLGGIIGAFRGGSTENTRANLDQSLYKINMANSYGRGMAQVQQMPQQQMMQPVMREEVAPMRRDTPTGPQVDSMKTMAGSPVKYDGTINAAHVRAL